MVCLLFPSSACKERIVSPSTVATTHTLDVPQPLSPVPLSRPIELGVIYHVLLLALKEGALMLATFIY